MQLDLFGEFKTPVNRLRADLYLIKSDFEID
jgi:hypothetical protein